LAIAVQTVNFVGIAFFLLVGLSDISQERFRSKHIFVYFCKKLR